jgi:hypothetical protein
MPQVPEIDAARAALVLASIDAILAWDTKREGDRDAKFVELGQYLCEVRSGQYWRLENLTSFDDFPQSRRKAYYLMSIHEHLPPEVRRELKSVGWAKATELVKIARSEGKRFKSATWLHKARSQPKDEFKHSVEQHLTGKNLGALRDLVVQVLQESVAGHRKGSRDRRLDVRHRQIPRLLPGDDLR